MVVDVGSEFIYLFILYEIFKIILMCCIYIFEYVVKKKIEYMM